MNQSTNYFGQHLFSQITFLCNTRKVVRKRDISLHTWTDWGTELRDAFLTITETAGKIAVPVYKYIHDRITGNNLQTSLAERIRLAIV